MYTDSPLDSTDSVVFIVYSGSSGLIQTTGIRWRFSDWGYFIFPCTPIDFSHKLTTTPPTVVNKTWEVRHTTDELKIKCNGIEVLHFIYNNTYDTRCIGAAKGKVVTKIVFHTEDTATKKFKTGLKNGK